MHRDLKPSNILIEMNEGLDINICDFGLARTCPKIEKSKKDYSREEMSKKLIDLQPERLKHKR